jgi:hypothetical protein
MNIETEIPREVIAEIEANRKVSAIKLLRSHKGIGLKEAKEIVDAYAKKHPSRPGHSAPKTEGGFGRILILIIGVGVIYGIYRYFT